MGRPGSATVHLLVYCTDLSRVQHQAGSIFATPLYCRRWTCPVCAPRRQRELRAIAFAGEPTSFLTLTVNPARGASPAERARALARAWPWLRRKLRERWPSQRFDFLAVFERTKLGEAHLHLLFRGPFVPQDWISDHMAARLGAPVVWINFVSDRGRAAAYVAKYLAKAPCRWDGCKRYWRSQAWSLVPRLTALGAAARTYILAASIDELRRDQATTGITHARQVRGPPVTIAWWTRQVVEHPQ